MNSQSVLAMAISGLQGIGPTLTMMGITGCQARGSWRLNRACCGLPRIGAGAGADTCLMKAIGVQK